MYYYKTHPGEGPIAQLALRRSSAENQAYIAQYQIRNVSLKLLNNYMHVSSSICWLSSQVHQCDM